MAGRNRVRIELRLSRGVVELADEFAEVIGLRRNAFFVLAAAKFAVELTVLYRNFTGAKRDVLLDRIEKEILTALREARKSL